jgi:hypothetical protein
LFQHILEPAQVQEDNDAIPLTVEVQQQDEVLSQGTIDTLEVAVVSKSTAKQSEQHPFATVILNHCQLVTRDLEVIQQSPIVNKDNDAEVFITYVSEQPEEKQRLPNPLQGSITNLVSMKMLYWNIRDFVKHLINRKQIVAAV